MSVSKKYVLLHPLLREKVYQKNAEIAQLVEHDLAKVGVASSSLVFRSKRESFEIMGDNLKVHVHNAL